MQLAVLEAALRTVPIAMAIIDPQLRYIRVNEACAAMTGLPLEAHAGRHLREVNPLLSSEMERIMLDVLQTGQPCLNYSLSRATPHAPGGSLDVVMHITPFRDADGRIAGICSTATDMTPWKRLQEQFYHAQKLEAVGKLAAGIAHDFNNLVTVIGSYCDLVLMDLPPRRPPREEVEEIRRAARRATTLARRMLGTVRSSAVVPTPVNVSETVREALNLLRHAASPRIRLDIDCEDDRVVVLADPTQIEQVLLNLVINAVDATPDSGSIMIRTRTIELSRTQITRVGSIPSGRYAEVVITDSGSGMDATTLDRIFEPFFTTKPPGKGTGLGLATVMGIVRELGGGVDVESAPGHGTTFRILLPLVRDPRAVGYRSTPVNLVAVPLEDAPTILLVKTEDATRGGLARILARQGYRVLEATHGGEALRLLTNEPRTALIITDRDMPGLSGDDLAERASAAGRHLPVLFMTESPPYESSHEAKRLTNVRTLHAPFEIEEFLATVQQLAS